MPSDARSALTRLFRRTRADRAPTPRRGWPSANLLPESLRFGYGLMPLLLEHPRSAARLVRYLAIGWAVSEGWRTVLRRVRRRV